MALVSYRFLWLRFVFYGLTFVAAAMMLSTNIHEFTGPIARHYWVTSYLTVFGGVALMALAVIAVIRDLVKLRRH